MPLGQGWLKKWVKINNRHVVFPPVKEEEKLAELSDKGKSVIVASEYDYSYGGVDMSVKTAGTLPSHHYPYAESQAISQRIQSIQQRRRRLDHSISPEDLVREKLRRQRTEQQPLSGDQSTTNSVEKSSSTQNASSAVTPGSIASARTTDETGMSSSDLQTEALHHNHPQHHEDHRSTSQSTISNTRPADKTEEGSIRFVAGFFGADEPLPNSKASSEDQGGGYCFVSQLNDSKSSIHGLLSSMGSQQRLFLDDSLRGQSIAASVHHFGPHYDRLDGASSVASRGGQSLPANPRSRQQRLSSSSNNGPYHLKRSNSQDSRGGFGGIFPLFSGGGDNNVCRQCTKLENEMSSKLEDIEYLRSMALRSEYFCRVCHGNGSSSVGGSNQWSTDVANNLIKKHKVQIEKLTTQMTDHQKDAQMKLQKFAHLCRDLNEEATIRNGEAIELHRKIDSVRQDRDKLSAELEAAKAKIKQYENDLKEQPRIMGMQRLEAKKLDGVEKSIQTRDKIIVDLSTRLDRALKSLEFERDQQRQRRQIIFPSQRSSLSLEGGDLEADMKVAKENLRVSQATVECLQHTMMKKEQEWMLKFENLERQLEVARAGSNAIIN